MVLARGDFSSACSENVLNEVCEKPVHMMCERDACVCVSGLRNDKSQGGAVLTVPHTRANMKYQRTSPTLSLFAVCHQYYLWGVQ